VNGSPKFADVGLVTEMGSKLKGVTYLGTEGYIAPEGPGRHLRTFTAWVKFSMKQAWEETACSILTCPRRCLKMRTPCF